MVSRSIGLGFSDGSVLATVQWPVAEGTLLPLPAPSVPVTLTAGVDPWPTPVPLAPVAQLDRAVDF
jgi:hypothetical protein